MSAVRLAPFPDKMTYVPVPAPFLGSLLKDIDSLAELKTTLHLWRLLHEQRGATRFIRHSELLADAALLLALRTPDGPEPQTALDGSLARAVERGTFLRLHIHDGDSEDACYLLNTEANQRVLREFGSRERPPGPFESTPLPAEVGGRESVRPSIFELYEQNIGLLTPLLAEELREAEVTYPAAWIEDAFREAVGLNKRSWRYIRRILENWAARGRGTSGETGRRPDPPQDSRRYLEGKYGRFVRR